MSALALLAIALLLLGALAKDLGLKALYDTVGLIVIVVLLVMAADIVRWIVEQVA